MARLLKYSLAMPELQVPFSEKNLKEVEAHFEKFCAEHDVLSFGVADSYAHYLVVKRKPLTLQHIYYMDGYQIPAAHVRGLTLADVDDMLRRDKAMAALFAKKETAK
jgi:hypothetical protein